MCPLPFVFGFDCFGACLHAGLQGTPFVPPFPLPMFQRPLRDWGAHFSQCGRVECFDPAFLIFWIPLPSPFFTFGANRAGSARPLCSLPATFTLWARGLLSRRLVTFFFPSYIFVCALFYFTVRSWRLPRRCCLFWPFCHL